MGLTLFEMKKLLVERRTLQGYHGAHRRPKERVIIAAKAEDHRHET